MGNTKDHVEAYAYEGRRQATSLLRGADEAAVDPRRRINRGAATGLVIAVLVMAGFGIAGWLGAGSGPGLPDSGAVIVRDTGDTYVAVDGVVHPALNVTSALLVGGGQVTHVKASALAGKQRGLPIGIPNAPNSLPGKEKLTNAPWTACAVPAEGNLAPPVDLVIGAPAPAEGRLAPDAAIVVRNAAGREWLIMQGRRFPLEPNARRQLDLQFAPVVTLPDQVIATVPEGPVIAAPTVAGQGGRSTVDVPGTTGQIGDLVSTSAPGIGDRFSVIQRDGLTRVTPLVFTLLVGNGARVSTVDPSVVARAPVSALPAPGSPAWPDVKPRSANPMRGQPVCVSTTPGAAPGNAAWIVEVSQPSRVPSPPGFSPVAVRDVQGVLRSIVIAPGTGAVIKAVSSSGQDGAITLITDAGLRYPIPPGDAVQRLGYDPAALRGVPKSFVELLPAGPVLDPEAARREFPGV
ncbi:type VII secretion protein EccB [Herbihabitans rhizosphaerae]|uniref:Type VII secretion protein EccB n=1 Tax=Herbihabitans rhizosphaerae TaxID=1872711 RepID=A0A4Q7L1Z1_9PSEU|nr:type VII secretion protein EccB [Herbihabitans rhizosphaerae]RZS43086.1 type VII secretion protein EccB [Herbihabitans rhizosphaerae]